MRMVKMEKMKYAHEHQKMISIQDLYIYCKTNCCFGYYNCVTNSNNVASGCKTFCGRLVSVTTVVFFDMTN